MRSIDCSSCSPPAYSSASRICHLSSSFIFFLLGLNCATVFRVLPVATLAGCEVRVPNADARAAILVAIIGLTRLGSNQHHAAAQTCRPIAVAFAQSARTQLGHKTHCLE